MDLKFVIFFFFLYKLLLILFGAVCDHAFACMLRFPSGSAVTDPAGVPAQLYFASDFTAACYLNIRVVCPHHLHVVHVS